MTNDKTVDLKDTHKFRVDESYVQHWSFLLRNGYQLIPVIESVVVYVHIASGDILKIQDCRYNYEFNGQSFSGLTTISGSELWEQFEIERQIEKAIEKQGHLYA